VIADNQNPALTGLRKQAAHGWWEQWVAAANLESDTAGTGAAVTVNANGTMTLQVTTVDGVAEARVMTILEGFKGGKIEISVRYRVSDVPSASETADLILVALGQPLGQATFTTVELANIVGDAIEIDENAVTTIQEISAVFETTLADGDNLEIGLFLQKTADFGPPGAVDVEFAGIQIAQIMQQSVPRGGNR
jgi:hypothetical protein